MEHRACCEQSGTERNTGLDDGGSDPAASRRAFRDYHGSRALTRCCGRIARGTWLGGRAGIAGAGTARAVPRRWNIAFLSKPENADAHQEILTMDSTVSTAWVGWSHGDGHWHGSGIRLRIDTHQHKRRYRPDQPQRRSENRDACLRGFFHAGLRRRRYIDRPCLHDDGRALIPTPVLTRVGGAAIARAGKKF